jgi:glycosyltransferase involved in cell wall biosynthesis
MNAPFAPAATASIAVLLPCYNEASTIAGVVEDFKRALPEATIYVLDNNSRDDTAAIARAAGAQVLSVLLQGKGNVVRRAFADIEADIYLMADGDSTYDASRARELIAPILAGEVDCVIGTRDGGKQAFPPGHVFGNRLFNLIVGRLFGRGLQDIFSGYRAFSRRFAKSFPAHSEGFEIETELSIYMLEQRIPLREIPTAYGVRPEGSHSKLNTYRDGVRILFTILRLFKESRPAIFFSLVALLLMLASLGFGVPVIFEYRETGEVARFPTAILAMGIGILACLVFIAGMMLDSLARIDRETRHLRYLNVPPRR